MKITKARLVDLIKEEAGKMTVPEGEVVEEGIFDFLTNDKFALQGEKLNKAFGYLVAEDQRLKTMIQDSTRDIKRLFKHLEAKIDKLASPEEPKAEEEARQAEEEAEADDGGKVTTTMFAPTSPEARAKYPELEEGSRKNND
tara:strand:+ start:103 stop:528 length:426 start_codon:yes stop_codon:yes gene_type:complete